MKSYNLVNQKGDAENLIVTQISHQNPYDYTKLHRHSYFEFILFEHGNNGTQVIDLNQYKIKSRHLYVVVPNQVHLMKRKSEEKGIIIQFTPHFLNSCISPIQLNWLYQIRTNPMTALSEGQFSELHSSMKKLNELNELNDVYSKEKVRHYFAYLIFSILDILPTNSFGVEKYNDTAYQFINLAMMNFKQQRVVREYAKKLNISVSKLNKTTKERFGKTPLEIIHDLMVLEIKRLILLEQLPNKEIYLEMNFDSQGTYNKFVKKHTGHNPSDLKIRYAKK